LRGVKRMGRPDCHLHSIEECDTQSEWSDEGSVASEFEPCDTDRQEIVEGWVMDQASDGHQEDVIQILCINVPLFRRAND